jgi:hypothetical protein
MLDDYFKGTLPQLIERAKLLKGKIPTRRLPRDYEASIQRCQSELDNIIQRFRELEKPMSGASAVMHQARLRQFKRAVAELDRIELRGFAALHRAHEDDHQLNRLLFRICKEIEFPALPPTVTTLSKGYFYIDPGLNLLFIPPVEGSFLLHLPDLYHELCHPLLTHKDHPVLDRFRARFLECSARLHDHFADQRSKQTLRRGPQGFRDDLDTWEILWVKYWLAEFFCDLFAIFTLGPAYAWSHLHLFMKTGGNAYELPTLLRPTTHPSDAARMSALLVALRKSDFQSESAKIEQRWTKALDLTNPDPDSNYNHCYPEEILKFITQKVGEGVADLECRLARPDTSDPVHLMLNTAWRKFWEDPANYHRWEAAAVKQIIELANDAMCAV